MYTMWNIDKHQRLLFKEKRILKSAVASSYQSAAIPNSFFNKVRWANFWGFRVGLNLELTCCGETSVCIKSAKITRLSPRPWLQDLIHTYDHLPFK